MSKRKRQARSDPPTEHEREFFKLLRSISHANGINNRQAFDDFLELAYCSIAKTTYPAQHDTATALEARYMAVVDRHGGAAYQTSMAELAAIAWRGIAAGGDFLGDLCSSDDLPVLDQGLGQVFTPYVLAKFIAKATLDNAKSIIDRQGFVTLMEPACGAGVFVIAAADVMRELGFDPSLHLWATAIDISAMCFRMTYIQLAMRGIAADVIHGNALSAERWEVASTPAKFHFVAANASKLKDWLRSGDVTTDLCDTTEPAAGDMQLGDLPAESADLPEHKRPAWLIKSTRTKRGSRHAVAF